MLRTLAPMEREIETQNGACFIRRVLPYRTQNDGVEGVVITFADVTDRRHAMRRIGRGKASGGTGDLREVPVPGCGKP